MSEAPEFSRPVGLESIGAEPQTMDFAASADERRALARRFDLTAVDALESRTQLTRTGETVRATGSITAHVVQSCVVTGDPVATTLSEPFDLHFVPDDRRVLADGDSDDADDEGVELGEGDCETLFYSGDAIDLGEAAAQTMALALNPFPRGADAQAALREAGVLSEEDTGPFAALKALKFKAGD